MEGVRLPSPEIWGWYLKIFFLICCQTHFFDFVSDVGVTDHRQYDQ